jgi:hypothetical protein
MTEQAIASQVAALNRGRPDPTQPDRDGGQVHIYFDYSNDIRGYFRGATCGDCVASSGDLSDEELKKAKENFYDPAFAILVRDLSSLPLKVLPNTSIRYHLFAEKMTTKQGDGNGAINQGTLDNLVNEGDDKKGIMCYKLTKIDRSRRQDIKEGYWGESSRGCTFDVKDYSNKESGVGSRKDIKIGDVFDVIRKDQNPKSLYIVATDLFTRQNQDISGITSPVIKPLADLINLGFEVRLYGFKLPFQGRIGDVPSPFYLEGQLPFYFIVVGAPGVAESFDQVMKTAASEIRTRNGLADFSIPIRELKSLAESKRFESQLIGAGKSGGAASITATTAFPRNASPYGTPLVINAPIDDQQTIPSSANLLTAGAPVSVTWSAAGTRPLRVEDYDQTIRAWRWNRAVRSGECSQSWQPVRSADLNAAPLTVVGPSALQSQIFRGGNTFNVEPQTPYIIQLSLYELNDSLAANRSWVDSWSSNTNFSGSDVEEARKPGAFIGTYNLTTFVDALRKAVPPPSERDLPVASRTIAVLFR